jgi:PAS domain S-box-containing protein
MNTSFWCVWYAFGDVTVPKLIAQESAALIVLTATLVVYRTFRERYLLIWILGWSAYLASNWRLPHNPPWLAQLNPLAVSQTEFVVAVCLFAAAIFVYTHSRKMLLPLLLAGIVVASYAAVRPLWWPDSPTYRMPLEISYRLIALVAAIQLIRYRWARGETGPWLLGASLLFLHLDWAPVSARLPLWAALVADLLLGTSMLLVVFDDSKMRTRRLGVINTLTESMTRAQQPGPMMVTALEELKALMGAKAAWFRLLEDDDKLVIAEQIGLSHDFVRDRLAVPKDDGFERTIGGGVPLAVKISSTDEAARPLLRKEGFRHCILVPVVGKKSIIGTLTMGSRRRVSYTPEEMEFLSTTAHQLGLAIENLRLLEQILRSHKQWTNTFDSIQDVVLLHDANYRILKANLSLLRRLQRAPVDVIGNTCEGALPQMNGQWTGCPYCQVLDSFYEGPDPCFGGISMVSTSSYSEQASQLKGTIHVIRDVTDRHLAEEKYRLLFQQMQEGVFVATAEGQLLDCNDAFVRMLGYSSREEVMALNLDTEVYASAERREAFRREVELHNYVRNFEVQLRGKDGNLLSAMESSFVTRDTEGKIERYQGFLLDISEKKQVEDEIRRRNRELNAMNAMAMIASQSFDLDEILNLTLRQMLSLLGARAGSIYVSDSDETTYRRRADWGHSSAESRSFEIHLPGGFGELVTGSRAEVLTAEYLPHLPQPVAQFISSGWAASCIWVLLWGTERPVGLMGVSRDDDRRYTNSDENLLIATGRQLATTVEKVRLYEETCRAYEDLRRAQEQLLQSEKMSAIGQLIAGVAHELNNPLTAILGYAQLLESEQLAARASDFVAKLFRQAQRTHRVVQNLLSFARQRKPQRQDVDVCKILEETLTLREYDLRVNNIQLERDIASALPMVTADAHQLEQVFLNIINNAVDAMLEVGQSGRLKVTVHGKDDQVFVEFEDSGPGIKEPSRIFDPFYTTKSIGKGTGLGLSICYGIIKEHGGEISARNLTEGGAVIEVRLPAGGSTAAPERSLPAARHEPAMDGRVLLVEDEEAVLEFERDVLAGAGLDVVASMNAEEAKARILQEPFQGLIINGKMPGGWGPSEIYHWLEENRPGAERHLLFTFSTVAESEIRDFLRDKGIPYLVKPFEVADLITQARKLLQKADSAVAG